MRSLRLWPGNNEDLIFPCTNLSYHGYTRLWWDFLKKDKSTRTYYALLKFGLQCTNISENPPLFGPDWMEQWWKTLEVNLIALEPSVLKNIKDDVNEPLQVVIQPFKEKPHGYGTGKNTTKYWHVSL